MIYLDNAASVPLRPEAGEVLLKTALEQFGNPGGVHAAAAQARNTLNRSRKALAGLLAVPEGEVVFTSGGTESNNWAVRMGALASGRRHIVCGACEHKSVLAPLRALEREGFSVTLVSPDAQGHISPEAVEKAMRPETGLVCVQAANNETGAVQDVAALSEIAHRHRALCFCDAVQSFGHLALPLHRADLLSLSAHKLGGPRGVGALVLRRGLTLPPLVLGGGQEFGLRAGTENVPGIAAFAAAAELACREIEGEAPRLTVLRELFAALLREGIPGLIVHGGAPALPGVLNCALPRMEAEELLMRLDLLGICASAGAACAAQDAEPSHVLLAMGCSAGEAKRSVRFSLGWTTTEAEIRRAAAAVIDVCN